MCRAKYVSRDNSLPEAKSKSSDSRLWTYRENNLRHGVAAGLSRARAVRRNAEKLRQLDLALGVSDFVSNDGVAQLSNEVGKSLAALDDKGKVARTRTSFDADGRDARHLQAVRVEGVEMDEIHAQIGDKQELARGVEDRLVRVRRVLAIGIGGRAGQLEVDGLDQLQVGGIGNVPCGEGRATAVSKKRLLLANSLF